MENSVTGKFKYMNKMIIGSVIIIIALFFGLYFYYGGCYDIKIRTEKAGGETMVYKRVTGDYKQTSAVTTEVYNYLLNDLKIETYKGAGIFYDNPQQVKKEELRSEAGCIIEPEDISKLDTTLCKYEIKQLPHRESAVTEFPYKGGISILIGLLRVYPKLEKYVKTHHLPDHPAVEIYDIPNKKIMYRR